MPRPLWLALGLLLLAALVPAASAARPVRRPTGPGPGLAYGARISPLLRHGSDDTLLLASAGNGAEKDKDKDDDDEDKKTLSQQVAEGKYGLIQKELFSTPPRRPGIISYKSNPEVPGDTAANLGGLDEDEIWLAEDHLLVLRGGAFNDKPGVGPRWPPIDDYQAPPRQVKLPAHPRVPPPFPVRLSDGGPTQFLTSANGTPPFSQGFIPLVPYNASFLVPPFPFPPPGTGGPLLLPPGLGALPLPFPPPLNASIFQSLPPGAAFLPPPANLSEPLDEDDPSIYYPPPYDFYYPKDNTSVVPPGPLVPGIILPPPPDFFAPLEPQTSPPPQVSTTTRRPLTRTRRPPSKFRPSLPFPALPENEVDPTPTTLPTVEEGPGGYDYRRPKQGAFQTVKLQQHVKVTGDDLYYAPGPEEVTTERTVLIGGKRPTSTPKPQLLIVRKRIRPTRPPPPPPPTPETASRLPEPPQDQHIYTNLVSPSPQPHPIFEYDFTSQRLPVTATHLKGAGHLHDVTPAPPPTEKTVTQVPTEESVTQIPVPELVTQLPIRVYDPVSTPAPTPSPVPVRTYQRPYHQQEHYYSERFPYEHPVTSVPERHYGQQHPIRQYQQEEQVTSVPVRHYGQQHPVRQYQQEEQVTSVPVRHYEQQHPVRQYQQEEQVTSVPVRHYEQQHPVRQYQQEEQVTSVPVRHYEQQHPVRQYQQEEQVTSVPVRHYEQQHPVRQYQQEEQVTPVPVRQYHEEHTVTALPVREYYEHKQAVTTVPVRQFEDERSEMPAPIRQYPVTPSPAIHYERERPVTQAPVRQELPVSPVPVRQNQHEHAITSIPVRQYQSEQPVTSIPIRQYRPERPVTSVPVKQYSPEAIRQYKPERPVTSVPIHQYEPEQPVTTIPIQHYQQEITVTEIPVRQYPATEAPVTPSPRPHKPEQPVRQQPLRHYPVRQYQEEKYTVTPVPLRAYHQTKAPPLRYYQNPQDDKATFYFYEEPVVNTHHHGGSVSTSKPQLVYETTTKLPPLQPSQPPRGYYYLPVNKSIDYYGSPHEEVYFRPAPPPPRPSPPRYVYVPEYQYQSTPQPYFPAKSALQFFNGEAKPTPSSPKQPVFEFSFQAQTLQEPRPQPPHKTPSYKTPRLQGGFKPSSRLPVYGPTTPKPYTLPAPTSTVYTTSNPLYYYTQQDDSVFDEITKKYFSMFGRKLPSEGDKPRVVVTTPSPLPAPTTAQSLPAPRPFQPETEGGFVPIVSLADDTLVNYRNPLPAIDPDAEIIDPHSLGAHGAKGAAPGPGNAFISYQLPGNGGHFYFLTPQLQQQRHGAYRRRAPATSTGQRDRRKRREQR